MKPNSGGVYIQDASGALTLTNPDPREQQRIARVAKSAAASEPGDDAVHTPRRPAGEVLRQPLRPRRSGGK